MEEKTESKSLLKIIIVIISIFIIQQLASKFGESIANFFNYSTIDSHSVFAWISVHHIIQLIFALIIIIGLSKLLKLDFKFKIGNRDIGIKYVVRFTIVILIYILISYAFLYYFNHVNTYNYELTIRNIIGSLGFQLFLSGTSEEVLFRALPITIFIYMFGKNRKVGINKWNISLEVIIAALFFSIAHINWSLEKFIISVDMFQLIYAFILGVIYGVVYEKSESIIYPILMHGISNFLMVGIGYLIAVL